MEAIAFLKKRWNEEACLRPFYPGLCISDEGLLLGVGTVLIPMVKDQCGRPFLAVEGDEVRLLAQLSFAYQKPISSGILKPIGRASLQWSKGEKALANLELAYAALQKFKSRDDAWLLFCVNGLIAEGYSPRWLMHAIGVDTSELDLLKYAYDPGQPRVPAGNSIESGRWTSAGTSGNIPNSSVAQTSPSQVMSDVNPDPVKPGQQYAQNRGQFPWGKLPVVGGRGGGGGAGPGPASGDAAVAKTIEIPAGRFGEAGEHMQDAIRSGKPDILTIDRAGAEANRAAATGAMDRVPGMHLDEYPPAMFLEGGVGASVRAISPKDNMSMGAHIGNCC